MPESYVWRGIAAVWYLRLCVIWWLYISVYAWMLPIAYLRLCVDNFHSSQAYPQGSPATFWFFWLHGVAREAAPNPVCRHVLVVPGTRQRLSEGHEGLVA